MRNIAAASIADPVVKRLVSAEALTELLAVGWPITVLPDRPPGTNGITRSTIGTIWQIFGNSEYGLGRFEVAGPAALPPRQRFSLTFRLLQWRWRCERQRKNRDIEGLIYLREASTCRRHRERRQRYELSRYLCGSRTALTKREAVQMTLESKREPRFFPGIWPKLTYTVIMVVLIPLTAITLMLVMILIAINPDSWRRPSHGSKNE